MGLLPLEQFLCWKLKIATLAVAYWIIVSTRILLIDCICTTNFEIKQVIDKITGALIKVLSPEYSILYRNITVTVRTSKITQSLVMLMVFNPSVNLFVDV